MNSWQKKHAEAGLCIFCSRPAASGSGVKAPKCEFHREARRKLDGHPKPYLSWGGREQRRKQLAEYAAANPFVTVRELSKMFKVTESTTYKALAENDVVPAWVKLEKRA